MKNSVAWFQLFCILQEFLMEYWELCNLWLKVKSMTVYHVMRVHRITLNSAFPRSLSDVRIRKCVLVGIGRSLFVCISTNISNTGHVQYPDRIARYFRLLPESIYTFFIKQRKVQYPFIFVSGINKIIH